MLRFHSFQVFARCRFQTVPVRFRLSKSTVFKISWQKCAVFRVNGRPICHIFHRFQNSPVSCESSLISQILFRIAKSSSNFPDIPIFTASVSECPLYSSHPFSLFVAYYLASTNFAAAALLCLLHSSLEVFLGYVMTYGSHQNPRPYQPFFGCNINSRLNSALLLLEN